jgi:hypothetical protein
LSASASSESGKMMFGLRADAECEVAHTWQPELTASYGLKT